MFRNILICVLVSFLLLSCESAENSEEYPTYDEYIRKFNKDYDEKKIEIRRKIYQNRVASFIKITDYQPGVNEFTDWTDEEIEHRENETEQIKSQFKEISDFPTSFDWRTRGIVTPVRNQGACGSCWAFSAVAYAESKLVLDGRYTNTLDLAEQRLLQCTPFSSCAGGYMNHAMNSLLNEVPFEFVFKYNTTANYANICTTIGCQIGEVAENYYNMGSNQLISILLERPVAVTVSATGWVNYASGIFSCNANDPINHGVLLVGYDANSWIIKNSWGNTWGDNGYIRISRTNGNNCSIGSGVHRTFEMRVYGILGIVGAIVFGTLM